MPESRQGQEESVSKMLAKKTQVNVYLSVQKTERLA